MVKRILRWAAVVLAGALVLLIIVVYVRTRPSGDIDAYASLYTDDIDPPSGGVKVTFFGVSTLLLDDGETQLLVDGFFSRYPITTVLLSDMRSDTAAIHEIIKQYHMNRVGAIFVGHSHYDHAFDVAYVTRRTGAILHGSESTLNIARGGGIGEEQLQRYSPGEDLPIGNFMVRVVDSRHSPGNALKDDNVTIDSPLPQPAGMNDYAEGGCFDFYIRHKGHSLYIKPSPNYLEGALDSLRADALFMAVATVTRQPADWQEQYYRQTVGKLKPRLVVPIHWDDFFEPVTDRLVMLPRFACDVDKDFDYFISRTRADTIEFRILQGTKSIQLFYH